MSNNSFIDDTATTTILGFCRNSPIWWHPTDSLPNFSQCLRLTLLNWIPLLFMTLLAPAFSLQLWRSRKRGHQQALPLSPLILIKFGLCVLLLALAVAQLFKFLEPNDQIFSEFPMASILSIVVKIVNLLVLFIGMRIAQLHGFISMGILHLSWLVQLLCSMPNVYTAYLNFFTNQPKEPGTSEHLHLILSLCYFVVQLVQFILFFFADPRYPYSGAHQSLLDHSGNSSAPADDSPNSQHFTKSPRTKQSPEFNSSFFCRLTYTWFRHLPKLGRKKDLSFDDLYDLTDGNKSQYLVPKWERSWLPAVEKYYQKRREQLAQGLGRALLENTKISSNGIPTSSLNFDLQKKNALSAPREPSVIVTLFKIFKWELFASGTIKAFADVLQFANPFLLRQLIFFVGNPEAQLWQGLCLAFAMFVCSEIRSLCVNYYFFIMFRMGTKIQTILTAAVFKKALKLSNNARRERTVGEIMNLMAIDVERFQMITSQIQQFWSSPLQISLALMLLFNTLGVAALPGVVIMSIIIPLSFISSFFTRRWQIRQMQLKDQRSKLCNEILNGIKVIKLYAWEVPMMEAIEKIRAKELKCLFFAGIVRSVIDTLNFTSPFFVAIGTFTTFCIMNPSALTPEVAFVSLTLFNQLRSPMTMIGFLINLIVQTAVSNKRILEFLVAEELDQNAIERIPQLTIDIRLNDADFAWENSSTTWIMSAQKGKHKKHQKSRSQTVTSQSGPSHPTLQNIDLQVQRGQFIAIVGKVGAGKSSLLAALLGEMEKVRGNVQLRQGLSLAYVPQQAWIQNMSLRRNITFGRPFCQQLYNSVLDACALKADLSMLAQGDATEIGEKGINLSGGQKARVALARALYQQSDMYLLDDPLSAVDSHVGRWIFDKVIGPEGMLHDRTRILVTHRLNFLQHADQIFLLDEGRIIEKGNFDELASRKGGKFAEVMAEGNLAEKREERAEINEIFEEIDEEPEDEDAKEILMTSDSDDVTEMVHMERMIRQNRESERHQNSSMRCVRRCRSRSISSSVGAQSHQSFQPQDKPKAENQAGQLIEQERVETGRVKLAVYYQYMRACGLAFSIFFLLFFTANQGTQILRNFWLSLWADGNEQAQGLLGNSTSETGASDVMHLVVYGALGICEASFFFLSLLVLLYGSQSGSRNLHSPMLLRIMQAPMAFFDTTPIGRLLNRFGKDIDVTDTILPLNTRYFVQCLWMVMATLITICISTPAFGLVIFPLLIFYLYILNLFVPMSRQLKRLESSHRSPIYSHFGETIQGAQLIRAFARQNDFCALMYKRVDALIRIKYLSLVSNRWLGVRLEFVGNCVVLFAALFGALSREWNLVTSAGFVGLSVSYALSITEVMSFAIRQISELETNIVSIERLKEYSEVDIEAPWKISNAEQCKDWPERGEIRFENYSTRYRPGLDLVLNDINATIKPSEKVGIVGRTGAGKSSLTLALFRMVEPATGRIVIDGIDIGTLGLHDLRKGLTIIPQDPVLFSGTLRFNLDPFNRHSDAEIWETLEKSHLHQVASQLPDGLDYLISEGGENISVGQRQLLCLARALLRSTKILVLDEATASIDLATDALIQETIRQKFRNCTVFTIAHRLETILDYDRVIVLQQGKICEFDAPQTLLARNSLFSAMVADAKISNSQQQKYE